MRLTLVPMEFSYIFCVWCIRTAYTITFACIAISSWWHAFWCFQFNLKCHHCSSIFVYLSYIYNLDDKNCQKQENFEWNLNLTKFCSKRKDTERMNTRYDSDKPDANSPIPSLKFLSLWQIHCLCLCCEQQHQQLEIQGRFLRLKWIR